MESELPYELKECVNNLAELLKNNKIKYSGDIADFGNEVGFAIGSIIENMTENQIKDFIIGLRHGISLTNGTH